MTLKFLCFPVEVFLILRVGKKRICQERILVHPRVRKLFLKFQMLLMQISVLICFSIGMRQAELMPRSGWSIFTIHPPLELPSSQYPNVDCFQSTRRRIMDQENRGLDSGCCYVAELSYTNHKPPIPS